MSIYSDFQPYFDGNNLLAPNPVPSGTVRGSDNGPMFLSEYVLISLANNVPPITTVPYSDTIKSCTSPDNYLTRAPGDNASIGNPDNHYGVYAALVAMGVKPAFKFYWQLLRQPQLYFASLAANQSLSRWKVYQWPLAAFTAAIIATSCMFTDKNASDPRRLAWLLIKATASKSILCKAASLVWFRRLNKTYPNGMKDVAALYYQPHDLTNPYAKWWIA